MASYYLSRNGIQLGPFAEQELRNMLATGQASLMDLACVVGGTEWVHVSSLPGFAPAPGSAPGDSAGSGIIPYKNPQALVGYYLGVFGLIPCIGFFLAVPALVLGILGLKKANAMPGMKGKGHAWTAIILGAIGTLLWGVGGAIALIAPAMSKH